METAKSGPPSCWKPCELETGRCQAWALSQSRQCARKAKPPSRFCAAHHGTVTDNHAAEPLVVTEHLDTVSGLQTTPLSGQCISLTKNNTEQCKRRTTHQSGLCSVHAESSQRTNTPTAGALSDELVSASRQCVAIMGESSSQCKRRTTHASGLCSAHVRQQSEIMSREATVVRSDTVSQPGRQCISIRSDGVTRCQRRTRDESGLCASHHRQNEHDAETRKPPTPAQSQTRPTADTSASQSSRAHVIQEDKLIDNNTRRCAAITKDGKTRCRVRTSHESGVCSTHRKALTEGFEAQQAATPEDCSLSQQCVAFTKDGSTRCKRRTTSQDGLCSVHQTEKATADNETEFGSAHVVDDSEEPSEPGMLQCVGVTIDGQTQCKRHTAHPSGFCATHFKQQHTPDTEHHVTAESRTDNNFASDARRCAALTSDGVTKCKRRTTHPAGLCSTHLKQQQIASSSEVEDSQASEDDATHSEQTSSQARRCKAMIMDGSSRCKRHTSHPTGLCSSHLKHQQIAEKDHAEDHVTTQPLEAPSDAQARQCIELTIDGASRCKRHTSHPTGLCSSHLKHQQTPETDYTGGHVVTQPVELSSQAQQCEAMTTNGTRCRRHTAHPTGLCSSHLQQHQSAGNADPNIEKVRNQDTAKRNTGHPEEHSSARQCLAMTSDGTSRCKRHTAHPTGLCSSHLKQHQSAGNAGTTTEKIQNQETAKNDASLPEEHSNARRCAAVKSDGGTRCKRRTAHPSGLCSTHISRSRVRFNGSTDASEHEGDAEVPVDAYLGSTGGQQTQGDGNDFVEQPIEAGQITSRRCEGITSQGSQCGRRTHDASGLCSAHRSLANQCAGMVKDGTTKCKRRVTHPGGFCSVHADTEADVRLGFPSSSSASARRALFHEDEGDSPVSMATVALETEGLGDMEVDDDDQVPDVFFSLSESEGDSEEDDDDRIGVPASQPRFHGNSQPFAQQDSRPVLSGRNHQADQPRGAKNGPVWYALTPPPTPQKHGAEPAHPRANDSPRVHTQNTVRLTPNDTGLTGTGAVFPARRRHGPAPSGTFPGKSTPLTGQSRRLPDATRTPESMVKKGSTHRSSVRSQSSQPLAPPTPDSGVDTPYVVRPSTTVARRTDSNRSNQANPAPSPKKAANSYVTTVFRTPHGKKYHTASCQHFNPEFPLSLVEAHREGLGPCSKCSPPPAVIVYSTPTGTKYHTEQCRFFNPDHPVALGDVEKLGLDPCSRCSPPVAQEYHMR